MSKRKLLLADDSMTIQKVVNLTFADEGIEVFTVGNGSLAIEKLSEIEPDLVLADVHMPGLNGYEVCEQIRQNPHFQNIPVMLLVGSFEPFDENEAQRVGANDFLTKPFQSIRQLIQKVTTLLDNPKSGIDGVETVEPAVETEASNEGFPQANAQEDFYVEETTSLQSDSGSPNHDFSDAALDDEMIETSSVNNFENGFPASTSLNQSGEQNNFDEHEMTLEADERSEGEATNNKEDSLMEAEPVEMRQTEPISFDDIRDINSMMLAPTQSEREEEPQDFDAVETDISNDLTQPLADAVETSPAINWEQPAPSDKYDNEYEVELDLPSFQEQSYQHAEFELVDNEENHPAEAVSSGEDFESSAAPQMQTAEGVADDEPLELDLTDADMFRIDDEDSILDLDEEETVDEMPAVEFEPVPAMQETAVRQNFSEPSNNVVAQVGNQAVANMNLGFPPEVIEAIAQLVIEKLSDKVIERIAWEIVPDRFERIVRQQMDKHNS